MYVLDIQDIENRNFKPIIISMKCDENIYYYSIELICTG